MSEQEEMAIECNHHWIIASPKGPVSGGTCKNCGAIREFRNSMTETGWDGSGAHRRRAKQARK